MKKNILIILSLILALSSCAGMLDQYSHTAIAPDAVVESDLPSVRAGMYNRVQESPGTLSYVNFDFVGGDINQKEYTPKQLIDAELKSGSTMSGEWNGFYSALYQVNNTMYVAGRFPQSPIAKTTLGEAYYFRAYIYMCLVTRFGGVPLLRENTQDLVARASADDCWNLIYEDLTNAVDLLGSSNSYYYVSQDAAKALKARVCLYMGKKDEAKSLAEELITSGRYKFDTFENIFNTYPTRKNNSETIFAFLCQDQAQSGIQIDYATQKGVLDLQRAEEDAAAQFQTQRDQVSRDERVALDNSALYSEARGDRGGIGEAQYDLIMANAAKNRLAVNQAQTKLSTDTARQIADLRAQGEFKKADQLLELTQTYLSQLMQLEQWGLEYALSATQFNAQMQQWMAEFELSVGELMGNYKGLPTLGAQKADESKLASAGEALLGAGVMPSESQLAAMGMTRQQAQDYITAAKIAAASKGSAPAAARAEAQPP